MLQHIGIGGICTIFSNRFQIFLCLYDKSLTVMCTVFTMNEPSSVTLNDFRFVIVNVNE